MGKIEKEIRNHLFELQDEDYKNFHCRLMPTVNPDTVIGVRTPELRKLAKQLAREEKMGGFLKIMPHKYYDEMNLHGFILCEITDYELCLKEINKMLPYIDNWATCDLISPKVFKKHTEELLEPITEWMSSSKTYTIRFGIGMLMRFYLDNQFHRKYLDMVSEIRSEEYYVNMMIAWYFATALAKQYDATLPYIEKKKLDDWAHNKAIQKAIESRRVGDEQKAYLRTLKI